MKSESFGSFVDLDKKPLAVLPFLIGILYSKYKFNALNSFNAIIVFLYITTMFMLISAVGNYFSQMRIRNIRREAGVSNIGEEATELKEKTILILVAISLVLGLIISYRTNFIVLIIVILSYFFSLSYNYGPLPFSQ